MTRKEDFIALISAMNTKQLETVLTKNVFKNYPNVSFLEKLNEFFTEFNRSGNTHLEINKGIGNCTCNKGRKVYCFVGNKTKDYFTLSCLENEKEYYQFSTSCSDVSYDKKLDLNKFHYFSIKPKDTLEYKNHQKYSSPIQEYRAFSTEQKCSINIIKSWLKKHNQSYHNTVELLKSNNLNSVEKLLQEEFEILYGKLNIIAILHQKETYFEKQLEDYTEVKDSISKLKKWFEYQAENKNEYQLFSSVFYDNRELTHFNLKLDELILSSSDFKYTLGFMSIIEDSKSITFQGTIKTIYDIEVSDKTKTARTYTQQKIVLSIDDFCCSDYLVTFSDGRIKHLDNLSEGQYVKVLARLTGGQVTNPEKTNEYKHHLYGWRVEKLDAKPEIKKNTKEMDLYYKYILPSPF